VGSSRAGRQPSRAAPLIPLLAAAAVLAGGLYLLCLGVASLAVPYRTRRFLGGFASSAGAHLGEVFVRFAMGAAFVVAAPRMRLTPAFALFGWLLIGTTAFLAMVPWRWHRRFALWSVPLATRRMALFGLAAVAGGVLVLYSLLL
jgi:hypothetical protein